MTVPPRPRYPKGGKGKDGACGVLQDASYLLQRRPQEVE